MEENSTTTSLRKDIGEATLPFPNNVGAVTTPPLPRDVGVTGNSPSAATRNSSHATIVSYKDMIKNSPQFKGKNAKSPKTVSLVQELCGCFLVVNVEEGWGDHLF